jgi:competence protein ComEA
MSRSIHPLDLQEPIMIRNFFAALIALTVSFAAFATDVNRASQAELEALKGIGPGLSAKILKAREAGAFQNWPDLVQRVSGVGAGNAARLSQAGLTVGGVAFDPASMAKPAPAAAAAKKPREAKPAKPAAV